MPSAVAELCFLPFASLASYRRSNLVPICIFLQIVPLSLVLLLLWGALASDTGHNFIIIFTVQITWRE